MCSGQNVKFPMTKLIAVILILPYVVIISNSNCNNVSQIYSYFIYLSTDKMHFIDMKIIFNISKYLRV